MGLELTPQEKTKNEREAKKKKKIIRYFQQNRATKNTYFHFDLFLFT